MRVSKLVVALLIMGWPATVPVSAQNRTDPLIVTAAQPSSDGCPRGVTQGPCPAARVMEGLTPTVSRKFVGEGSATLFSDFSTVYGASSTRNEIGRSLYFYNNGGIEVPTRFVVGDFVYMKSPIGAAATYLRNDLMDIHGDTPSTIYELNFNNLGADSGDQAGQTSLYGPYPWKTMINFVSAGTGRLMSVLQIDAVPTHPRQFNRGLNVQGDSIRLNTIEDGSNSHTSYLLSGSHTTGIDMTAATLSNAIRLANSQTVSWRNDADDADVVGIVLDGKDKLQIGYGTTGISIGQTLGAGADAALSIGTPQGRFADAFLIRVHHTALSTVFDSAGSGSPEGVITASVGSTWRRVDGTPGNVFYVKESGDGNTGWVAK